MAPAAINLDDLVEHWTMLDDERMLVAGKRGATRLGFALLLNFLPRRPREIELPAQQERVTVRSLLLSSSGA